MAEIVKYVYVIIIFLSLILFATNIEGKSFYRFKFPFLLRTRYFIVFLLHYLILFLHYNSVYQMLSQCRLCT